MAFGEPPKTIYYQLYPPGWWGDAYTHPLPWVIRQGKWVPRVTTTIGNAAVEVGRFFVPWPEEWDDIPAMRPDDV